jgi:hypothetical protein
MHMQLALIRGNQTAQLQSATFQGATRARKGMFVATDKGSVLLIYSVDKQTISLREYNAGPGALDTKLKGSPASGKYAKQPISVMTLDGGSYEIGRNANKQIIYVEWKTLRGVLVVLNGLNGSNGVISQPFPLSFLLTILPSISR